MEDVGVADIEFPLVINRITKNFNKRLGDFLVPYGLSKLHSLYLACLFRHRKGLTLNELNLLTGNDKANTSRAISDMVEKGFVSRSSYDNTKKYKVRLTEKGIDVGVAFVQTVNESVKKCFARLSQMEADFFKKIVFKLLQENEYDSD